MTWGPGKDDEGELMEKSLLELDCSGRKAHRGTARYLLGVSPPPTARGLSQALRGRIPWPPLGLSEAA